MLDRAFEIKELLLNNTAGVLSGSTDPSTAYPVVPQGSIYLRGNGEVYIYKSTGWSVIGNEAAANTEYSTNITVTFGDGNHPGSYSGVLPNTSIANLLPTSKIKLIEPVNFIVNGVSLDNDVTQDSYYFLKQRFCWNINPTGTVGNSYFAGKVICDSYYNGSVILKLTWN